MESAQVRALALEGTWRIEFSGIEANSGVVDIENRGLVGASSSHHIRGDFRLNANSITAFVQLRGRTGTVQGNLLAQLKGGYDPAEIVLRGALVDDPALPVRIHLRRIPPPAVGPRIR